jgi:hypothetical protein
MKQADMLKKTAAFAARRGEQLAQRAGTERRHAEARPKGRPRRDRAPGAQGGVRR